MANMTAPPSGDTKSRLREELAAAIRVRLYERNMSRRRLAAEIARSASYMTRRLSLHPDLDFTQDDLAKIFEVLKIEAERPPDLTEWGLDALRHK